MLSTVYDKYPDFTEGQKFILVHMAASHANGSSDAFKGASDKGKKLAMLDTAIETSACGKWEDLERLISCCDTVFID